MVDWNTNEAGTVHRAEAAVRCSRFTREAYINRSMQVVLEGNEVASFYEVSIYANRDMEAAINADLEPRKTLIGFRRFVSFRAAKAWAESWLQP